MTRIKNNKEKTKVTLPPGHYLATFRGEDDEHVFLYKKAKHNERLHEYLYAYFLEFFNDEEKAVHQTGNVMAKLELSAIYFHDLPDVEYLRASMNKDATLKWSEEKKEILLIKICLLGFPEKKRGKQPKQTILEFLYYCGLNFESPEQFDEFISLYMDIWNNPIQSAV